MGVWLTSSTSNERGQGREKDDEAREVKETALAIIEMELLEMPLSGNV